MWPMFLTATELALSERSVQMRLILVCLLVIAKLLFTESLCSESQPYIDISHCHVGILRFYYNGNS